MNNELVLKAFLDFKRALENTSLELIELALRERGTDAIRCRWIASMLSRSMIYNFIIGETLVVQVSRDCPQEGVFSPLF